MRVQLIWVTLVLTSALAPAQDGLCKPASASTVNSGSSVIVQRVTLSGPWGTNQATVFLPDQEIADGGIVFSHSTIKSTDNDATTDLLPLALTLAHAGAAVIVPDRSITWPSTDRAMNREGAVVVCAARWLVTNVKVFNAPNQTVAKGKVVREPYGYVGPLICDPKQPSECHLNAPFDAAPGLAWVWVPVAETEGGDNTKGFVATGGLGSAKFLQRHLGLRPINQILADQHAAAR